LPIRTSCFASALLAACVLASTATAQTQPSPAPQTVTVRDLRFELVPGAAGSATIRVRRGTREVLSTTRTADAFDPERARPWVVLRDANFDGYPDIWVMQAMGMVNTTYSVELFDPRTQSFVAMPDFDALSNPTVDVRNRQITTAERGGCCSHTEATYRWRDARLEMIAEHGDEAATGEDGHVCFVRLWRRERRGAEMVDLPDRYVPLHRFNREAQPAPECRSARPPAGGRARAP
jgi:hypothetical protein